MDEELRKKLQEKTLEYQIVESRLNQLMQQQSLIKARLQEVEITKETLDEIEKSKGKEILISVGSLSYVHAKLAENEKIIVEVGAGAALPMSMEDAKKLLEKRKENLQKGSKKLEEEIGKTTQLLQLLHAEIQDLSSKAKGG